MKTYTIEETTKKDGVEVVAVITLKSKRPITFIDYKVNVEVTTR